MQHTVNKNNKNEIRNQMSISFALRISCVCSVHKLIAVITFRLMVTSVMSGKGTATESTVYFYHFLYERCESAIWYVFIETIYSITFTIRPNYEREDDN